MSRPIRSGGKINEPYQLARCFCFGWSHVLNSVGACARCTAKTYTFCANEFYWCPFTGTRTIRYGANNTFKYIVKTGGATCNNDSLLGYDCSLESTNNTPAPTPKPSPTPTKSAPTPTAIPVATINIQSPASGSSASSSITLKGQAGSQWVNIAAYDANNLATKLSGDVAPSNGSYSLAVDTTKLANGTAKIAVIAFSVAAGQSGGTSSESDINLYVQNNAPAPSPVATPKPTPAPTPTPTATQASTLPVGGPGGYSKLAFADSFGSSKSGATVTSVSQFNPSTSYGPTGKGWDRWMQGWGQSASTAANIAMMSDHLEIYPTNSSQPGFIASHFEILPEGSQRIYYEIRGTTGRGGYNGGSTTWPAYWLYSGNEGGATNNNAELDIMETYTDQAWGTKADSQGKYTNYFVSTTHTHGAATVESLVSPTPGDVTTNYNVYGVEVYRGSDPKTIMWTTYFNGVRTQTSTKPLLWDSSAPTILLGWNPGSTAESPAVMKIDYVRVWTK